MKTRIILFSVVVVLLVGIFCWRLQVITSEVRIEVNKSGIPREREALVSDPFKAASIAGPSQTFTSGSANTGNTARIDSYTDMGKEPVAQSKLWRSPFAAITKYTAYDDGLLIPDVNHQIAERKITCRCIFSAEKINFNKNMGFDVVEMEGCRQGDVQRPGAPTLPEKEICMLIPIGMKVIGVSFMFTETSLKKGMNFFPAQTPRPVSSTNELPFVKPDPLIYGSDDVFPANPAQAVSLSKMRSNRYLSVVVNPLRYRPKSGELLRVDSLKISLEVEPDSERSSDLPRHKKMDEVVRGLVINAELMDADGYAKLAGGRGDL